jgi:hypothetical protein
MVLELGRLPMPPKGEDHRGDEGDNQETGQSKKQRHNAPVTIVSDGSPAAPTFGMRGGPSGRPAGAVTSRHRGE